MTKEKLAYELKKRQYKLGNVPKKVIDGLSNDSIIDSYIKCSCCEERLVNEIELIQAINMANDVEHFFNICDEFNSKKHGDNT